MASTFTSRTPLMWAISLLVLVAGIAYSLGSPLKPPSVACAALSVLHQAMVSYPSSDIYNQSLSSYWSVQEESLSPGCIVTPANTEDVANVVKTLVFLGTQFAVRSGGHTPFAGSANIDGGVTIDLRGIRNVTINNQGTIASVGPGATWGDVYHRTDALGLAAVGGRGATIGVGGLAIGGGISYFSARKGFACDNVLNYEVVLASGRIVNANQEENSDLWVALRGGSNNFGIVTRYDIRTFPQGDLWGGMIVYASSTTAELLAAFVRLDTNDFDPYAALMLSFFYGPNVGFINSANIEYTAPVENPPTFQPFTSAQPQFSSTMRISNMSDLTTEFTSFQPNGKRQLYVTTAFKVDASFLTKIVDYWSKKITSLSNIATLQTSLVIQPIPPATTSKAAALGGDVLGLDPAVGPLVLSLLTFTWFDAGDDAQITSLGKSINEWIIAQSKEDGLWVSWLHLNYAASWQDPIAGYGPANVEALRAASRKYDPAGVFQRKVPGGFKLFK